MFTHLEVLTSLQMIINWVGELVDKHHDMGIYPHGMHIWQTPCAYFLGFFKDTHGFAIAPSGYPSRDKPLASSKTLDLAASCSLGSLRTGAPLGLFHSHGGYPRWMVYLRLFHGKSLKIDENWGYPYFRTPLRKLSFHNVSRNILFVNLSYIQVLKKNLMIMDDLQRYWKGRVKTC